MFDAHRRSHSARSPAFAAGSFSGGKKVPQQGIQKVDCKQSHYFIAAGARTALHAPETPNLVVKVAKMCIPSHPFHNFAIALSHFLACITSSQGVADLWVMQADHVYVTMAKGTPREIQDLQATAKPATL
jgi:hypothetical protein